MRALLATAVFGLVVGSLPAQTDSGWPRELNSGASHFVIYQPQVDSWKDDRLEARTVVMVTTPGSARPAYGIVKLSARTSVDKATRLVVLEEIKADSATFPAATRRQPELVRAVEQSLPDWPRTISLDRLLADLAMTQNETAAESIPLRNTPPEIIFSTTPAMLIPIDGEPVMRTVPGTRYSRVINTPALLLLDTGTNLHYLDAQTFWMTAPALNGPWAKSGAPPADLDDLRAQLNASEEKDPHAHPEAAAFAPGVTPAVYVSTKPAELIQTSGEPQYAPIYGTTLSYITNTESNIFLDIRTQDQYVLLSGRWFKARTLGGPWEAVSGKNLPSDFARIPLGSPKSGVLASVPGTLQAKEAVIANQIPQTATINRSHAQLDVRYDGPPQFRPIEGTTLEYAINTDVDVIRAGGRYYACQNAVWFVADSPGGPWAVADMIPSEIYTIPPSSPLYHDRFVYVYRATPDCVYAGYTPGYLGAYVWDGTVVFGTGWVYPAWYGDFYFGWPWTWGFGFQFGYWGGGWFWRPVAYPWWFHDPWYLHRIYTEHWNPHWSPHDAEAFRNNTNVYRRLPEGVAARAVTPAQPPVSGRPNRGDFYADHQGNVLEHRQDGWYQQNGSGQWQRTPSNPGLEQQRQSRSLGDSRQREFQRSVPSPGVPRSSPPAFTARPAAPSGRAPSPGGAPGRR
jgi:hypothetical protein